MHFRNGVLIGLRLDHGGTKTYSRCPPGPALVCVFDLARRISAVRAEAILRRLTFRDGVLVGEAAPASALGGVSCWPDLA
jgi:hypothetical protein